MKNQDLPYKDYCLSIFYLLYTIHLLSTKFTLQLILYYKKKPTIKKEAAIGKINVAEYIIPTIILKKILLKKFHSSNLSHTPKTIIHPYHTTIKKAVNTIVKITYSQLLTKKFPNSFINSFMSSFILSILVTSLSKINL